jgi:starch synthase (maltosyl-transferring)
VKWAADGNTVIVVINLDPFRAHAGTVRVPSDAAGVADGQSYTAHDLLTGRRYTWAERNYVHLDPAGGEPVHLFRIERG